VARSRVNNSEKRCTDFEIFNQFLIDFKISQLAKGLTKLQSPGQTQELLAKRLTFKNKFHTAPGFVWFLSYNSWFYTALDSVIQICLATSYMQLLVLVGIFPMAPGFVWFLTIGF